MADSSVPSVMSREEALRRADAFLAKLPAPDTAILRRAKEAARQEIADRLQRGEKISETWK